MSVFIQLQYRTNVLANVAYSLYLTFSLLTGWGDRNLVAGGCDRAREQRSTPLLAA